MNAKKEGHRFMMLPLFNIKLPKKIRFTPHSYFTLL